MSLHRTFRQALLSLAPAAALALLPACGADTPEAVTPPPATAAPAPPAPPATPAETEQAAPQEEAHRFAILAASCWFGGLWGDAEGQSVDQRKAADEARCHDVVKKTYGTDDQAHYERLRALEDGEVEHVVLFVEGLAKHDTVDGPRQENLVKLVKALAVAQREALLARRAGDKVKRDLKGDKEPAKLSKDEADAVSALKAHGALESLLKLDAGDLTAEAHAMGVLEALDRMEIARGLPRHMKIYAVGDAFTMLFASPPPDVPADATRPLKPGTWLRYLSDTAKAAGHAVPDTAKKPKDREPFAWTGVLAGFADKLRPDLDKISPATDFGKVAAAVVKRLDGEYAAVSAAATATDKPGAKPAGKTP